MKRSTAPGVRGCSHRAGPRGRERRRGIEREHDFAKTRGERFELLGELQAALVEIADVAREALDLREVVRGDEDGGVFGAREQAFDQLVADQRVEAGEGLVEHDQRGR